MANVDVPRFELAENHSHLLEYNAIVNRYIT